MVGEPAFKAGAERSEREGTKRRLTWPLLYPAAIPVVFVYNAWVESSIHFEHLMRPLAVVLLVSLAITALTTLLAGDRHMGAFAGFAITLAAVTSNPAAGIALVALAILVTVVVRMAPFRFGPTISRAATTIATVFLLVTVIGSATSAVPVLTHDATADLGIAGVAGDGPHLYVVLLDGYPGTDAARSLDPSWDRDRFPAALRSRGFQVVPESRSNYVRTALTLASMFSMRHVTPADDQGPSSLRWMVDGGVALRHLRAAGYEIVAISSGFAPVDIHTADRRVAPAEMAELEISLMRSTNAGQAVTAIAPDLPSSQQRGRIEAIFKALEDEARAQGAPRFVFAHVPAPHGPFVYRADGSPRTEGLLGFYTELPHLRGASRAETIDRETQQATYVGNRALQAVDNIIGLDPTAAIAVFSDHGPGIDYQINDPLASGIEERVSNLLAVRSPDGAVVLGDGTTPINLFPLLLNAYAGTSIAPLPDQTFAWSEGATTPVLVTR